jgi:hypothetical protein
MKMNKVIEFFKGIDSPIDFFYGSILGAIGLLFGLSWFFVLTVPACAILYAVGGDEKYQSGYRDVGCAAVNSIALILATGNLLFLGAGLAVFGVLTIGLGLPSTQPPDPGSPVGRLAWKLANGKERLANIYTHTFLYVSVWGIYFATSLLRGIIWHN